MDNNNNINLLDQLTIVQSTLSITIDKLKDLNSKIGDQDNEYNQVKTDIALMTKDLQEVKGKLEKHSQLLDRELLVETKELRIEVDYLKREQEQSLLKKVQWVDRKIILFVAFIGFIGTLIGAILGVYAQKWIK